MGTRLWEWRQPQEPGPGMVRTHGDGSLAQTSAQGPQPHHGHSELDSFCGRPSYVLQGDQQPPQLQAAVTNNRFGTDRSPRPINCECPRAGPRVVATHSCVCKRTGKCQAPLPRSPQP